MSLLHISSEGGPIILGDFDAFRTWRGSNSDQYDAACSFLELTNPSRIALNGADVLVWDFGGPGTGDVVVVSDTHISIVRIGLNEDWTEAVTESVIVSSATKRYGTEAVATLTISSGYLLVLWAPEDASEFLPPCGLQGIPSPGLAIGDGGAYVSISCGNYEVTTCEWQTDEFEITKLDLRKSND